jgi:signal recognition particle GTPase
MMKSWLKDNISKIKGALFKTRMNLEAQTPAAIDSYIEINEDFYDSLLEQFIKADMGIDLSEKIIANLKKQIKEQRQRFCK